MPISTLLSDDKIMYELTKMRINIAISATVEFFIYKSTYGLSGTKLNLIDRIIKAHFDKLKTLLIKPFFNAKKIEKKTINKMKISNAFKKSE